jgi:hypothetical protein
MIKILVLFLSMSGVMVVGSKWLSNNVNDALVAAIFFLVVISLLMLFAEEK